MTIKGRLSLLTTAITLAMFGELANAASVWQATPVAAIVEYGDTAFVEFTIAGLSDSSLQYYDMDVYYDASVLRYTDVTWGSEIFSSTPSGYHSQAVVSDPGWAPGHIQVRESAFNPALADLQPDSFTLFTLSFSTVGTGTAAISMNASEWRDAAGHPFPAQTLPATFVGTTVTAVPAPAALPLFVSALAGISGFVRRRQLGEKS